MGAACECSDEADFSGIEYEASIERHLGASAKLIVVCSPRTKQRVRQ